MGLRHTFVPRDPGNRPKKAPKEDKKVRPIAKVAKVCNAIMALSISGLAVVVLSLAAKVDHARAMQIAKDAVSNLNDYSAQNVSLKIPKNWESHTIKQFYIVQTLKGQVNVEWTSRVLPPATTLETFSNQFLDYLLATRDEQCFVDKLIKDEQVILANNTPARKLLVSARVGAKRRRLMQMILLSVHNEKALILTCTAPSVYYPDFESLFSKIASSVALK